MNNLTVSIFFLKFLLFPHPCLFFSSPQSIYLLICSLSLIPSSPPILPQILLVTVLLGFSAPLSSHEIITLWRKPEFLTCQGFSWLFSIKSLSQASMNYTHIQIIPLPLSIPVASHLAKDQHSFGSHLWVQRLFPPFATVYGPIYETRATIFTRLQGINWRSIWSFSQCVDFNMLIPFPLPSIHPSIHPSSPFNKRVLKSSYMQSSMHCIGFGTGMIYFANLGYNYSHMFLLLWSESLKPLFLISMKSRIFLPLDVILFSSPSLPIPTT